MNPPRDSVRLKPYLATFLVALSTLISPWTRDLFVGDETKYSQIIREMRASGVFFLPRLGGEPYTHKPPLHFWLIDLLSYPFGTLSIWPYVLPSLIAFAAILFLINRIGREWFDEKTGALATFIFGASYLGWGLAQTARMDLGFTFFVSLSVLMLHRFLSSGRTRTLLLAALAAAVGILIKGPMAFVIPAVLLGIEKVRARRRGLGGLSAPHGSMRAYMAALLIVAAIPLAWLIPAIIMGGSEFAEEILVKQNVGRAVGSWAHREPFWFYPVHAPVTLFPWFFPSVLAIAAIYIRGDGRRWGPKSQSDHLEQQRPAAPLAPFPSTTEVTPSLLQPNESARFCVSWGLAVLVPFTLLSGKLDIYMLPLLPPLALVLARFMTGPLSERWRKTSIALHAAPLALLGIVASVGLMAGPRLVKRADEKALMDSAPVRQFLLVMLVSSLLSIMLILLTRRTRPWNTTLVTGFGALLPMLFLTLTFVDVANEHLSTAPLIRSLQKIPARGPEVALFGCPFLWSRDLPASLQEVRYIGPRGLDESPAGLPMVVASRTKRTPELGALLPANYQKVDEVHIRGMQFDVYRRR